MSGRLLLSVVASFLISEPTLAQTDHDPASEMISFRLAEGYELNLFASEELGVVKPIQMRWDERGRLWVACSAIYPQIEPGQKPSDRIVMVEDTNGDGEADRSVVFADDLVIPTGIELGDGGVYVGHGTELLHLRDTDGDGRADERRVVLRGFGTGDAHQNINSFCWGPGGELWFSQGLHAFSRVETPWGVARLHQAGVWRFRPRKMQLEGFYGEGMPPHNPWGFVFDDWGQPFVLAGNGHGIYYLSSALVHTPHYRDYAKAWDRSLKFCGGDIVGTSAMPADLQGQIVAGAFMNNAVWRFAIADDGAGFALKELPPLLKSSSSAFRPVDVKMGPDGAIYVADWYNPIIGHYQASFRHPDRDKQHGRIWRIGATGFKPTPAPRLDTATASQLVEQLSSTDRWTRYQAKRLLRERASNEVIPALRNWVKQLDATKPPDERSLVEALGLFEAHEVVEQSLVERLVSGRDFRARAYATSVIGHWHDRLKDPQRLLDTAARDEHPRVRLQAIVAASYARNIESVRTILRSAGNTLAKDRFIEDALVQAVHALKPVWQPQLEGPQVAFTASELETLLRADASVDSVRAVAARLKQGGLRHETREAFVQVLANVGTPNELRLLLDPQLVSGAAPDDVQLQTRALIGLGDAWRLRKVRPDGDLVAALKPLLNLSKPDVQAQALRLAGVWGLEPLRADLELSGRNAAAPLPVRVAALDGLAALGGDTSARTLAELSGSDSLAIRVAATAALARLDPSAAAPRASALLSANLDESSVRLVIEPFLQRSSAPALLAKAFESTPPSSDSSKLAMRHLNAIGHREDDLMAAFTRAAGIDASAPLAADGIPAFVREVQERGDARRGETIFRRKELACVSCHAIGGAGGWIGPDLRSIGSGQPIDFIAGAVLFPNKEVKEGFEAVEIVMKDEEIHQGYIIRANATEIVLRETSANTEIRLPMQQVKARIPRGSLMPAGLVNALTRDELRDLIRFLSELGKPGSYDVGNTRVIRQWEVLSESRSRFDSPADLRNTARWEPVFTRVSGDLVLDEMGASPDGGVIVLRHTIENAAGPHGIRVNSPEGLRVWCNGAPVALKSDSRLKASSGRVELVVAIDTAKRGGKPLRAEFVE